MDIFIDLKSCFFTAKFIFYSHFFSWSVCETPTKLIWYNYFCQEVRIVLIEKFRITSICWFSEHFLGYSVIRIYIHSNQTCFCISCPIYIHYSSNRLQSSQLFHLHSLIIGIKIWCLIILWSFKSHIYAKSPIAVCSGEWRCKILLSSESI